LNILLIGYMYGRGGIQTHTHFLATGLVERRHHVVVATPGPIHGDAPTPAFEGDYQLVQYAGLGEALRRFNIDRKLSFDAAVVCGTGWAAMAGVRALRGVKRRIFFEVMSGARSGYLDPRMLVHTGFDAIVGQARPVEELFCSEFNWRKAHVPIPALPDPLERSCEIPPRKRLELGADGKLRLVYFGRLAAHKGVDFLIENWRSLSEFAGSLDIYGTGPQFDELRTMIADKKLAEMIRLRGAYPAGQHYVELMQQYDLKLLPTIGAEGAPLVLLEAMACGLPFVANGVGGIPDYANMDCGITSGNRDEFLPLCRKLAGRIMAAEIVPERLQAHYRNHFAFERLVDSWEAFLLADCSTVAAQPQAAGEK
jgi:glycosyltransferase involved in cell wall biosynthesis